MVQIAIPTVEICNIISWNYVGTGMINRPLRLRNLRGKIYKRTSTCGLFIAQMYGSEHTARRRGRFIAPVFQSKPNGFNVSKWCELQCHFVELRGCGTMNCNTNGGNTQHHFGELRGYGHDKSAPTPTESTWKNISTNTHVRGIFAQIYSNEHSERRICQFIVPISSTNPIGFGMQNGTNCDTNSGNTQCHFVELRGIGHDKSVPTPTESTWENTATNTPWGIFANSSHPHHQQN